LSGLEFCGAGNLLVESQPGHMDAVGYDLYCKMLNVAVKHVKGETSGQNYTTTIDLNIDAYIPASYIPNEYQKLDIYKRIASIENEQEINDMLEELIDRFGDVPKKVQQLLHIAHLKALAHSIYVISIEQKGMEFKFTMYERANVRVQEIEGLLERYKGSMIFRVEANPYFMYFKQGKHVKEKDENILNLVKSVLTDIGSLISE